jgi:prevent-host-death family protein
MATGPFVVSVTEFRRQLSALIDDVSRNQHPLFLTLYGTVAAVLVSREEYGSWRPDERRGRDGPAAPGQPSVVPRTPPSRHSPRLTAPPERRIWTRLGMADFEVAAVLAEQGVETELIWTEEGWLTDDEG